MAILGTNSDKNRCRKFQSGNYDQFWYQSTQQKIQKQRSNPRSLYQNLYRDKTVASFDIIYAKTCEINNVMGLICLNTSETIATYHWDLHSHRVVVRDLPWH